jgi:hypothetical protein
MKKTYILILSLLVSSLRADDRQTLEKLVALTERSVALQEKLEQRLQEFDNYIAMCGNSVQDLFLNIVVPQILQEKKDMNREELEEEKALIKVIGVFLGVDLQKLEQALGDESQNSQTMPTPQVSDVSEKTLNDSK